MQKLNMLFSKS